MTEYEKWKQRMVSYAGTDISDLPGPVQEMLNDIPVAFKRAANDAGVTLRDDMKGPVEIWNGLEVCAKSRKLCTPGEMQTTWEGEQLGIAPDFYHQFLNEFTIGKKEYGLQEVAFYASDVMRYADGIGDQVLSIVKGVKYSYIVRYASLAMDV